MHAVNRQAQVDVHQPTIPLYDVHVMMAQRNRSSPTPRGSIHAQMRLQYSRAFRRFDSLQIGSQRLYHTMTWHVSSQKYYISLIAK